MKKVILYFILNFFLVDGPFIHHISKYFSSNFMKIKKNYYNNK